MDVLELAQPLHLWWLLLLPVLYLLSRPPQPQHDHPTAYLKLWLAARDRLGRRPIRFRWWRFLLLVLAFATVVIAHSGVTLAGRPGATDLVVLLDTSASMAAPSRTGRSALDEARDRVVAALTTTPPHVDVRLGLCGAEVEVVRGPRAQLRERLASVVASGRCRVDLGGLAARLRSERMAVWTLTDGLGPTAPPDVGARTVLGVETGNAAITRCTVTDGWPLPEVQVALVVQRSGPGPTSMTVRVHGGVQPVPARRVEPGQVGLRLVRTTGGPVEVTLAGSGDGFPADDSVQIVLPAPPRPTIALRAGPDASPALAAAARALAAEFGGRVVAEDGDKAGFLITSGGALPAVPAGVRLLAFGTAIGAERFGPTAPRVLDWSRHDPVTAGLDLSELRVERALKLAATQGVALIHGDQGPLALVRGTGDARTVQVAFRLAESNFYKLAAFPQFVRRAFARAYGQAAEARLGGAPLLDAAESALTPARAGPQPDRPLPAFEEPATRLTLPLLLLALACLAIRAYV